MSQISISCKLEVVIYLVSVRPPTDPGAEKVKVLRRPQKTAAWGCEREYDVDFSRWCAQAWSLGERVSLFIFVFLSFFALINFSRDRPSTRVCDCFSGHLVGGLQVRTVQRELSDPWTCANPKMALWHLAAAFESTNLHFHALILSSQMMLRLVNFLLFNITMIQMENKL